VRLIDVLLRPEVLVFEPLWTVIPGNKAILPVLWSLFPNHRYLLDTDFVVNEQLAKTGYAVKPISGRCGNNIDLIGPQDEVLDKTSGQFVDRKNIYQQLWCLPKWMANTSRFAPSPSAVTTAGPACAEMILWWLKKRAILSR
jgi:glutathionylspermidine amidase/synthetase